MGLFESLGELPLGWSLEAKDKRCGVARYRVPEGSIDLACFEPLAGIILTDIDLACPVLPAYNPLGSQLATVNWCMEGRCEVDFVDQGSLVVGKGSLCVSSTLAQGFAYPTGTYRGFELFVDLEQMDQETWAMLACLGLDRELLSQTLLPDGLGINLMPTGELADAVHALWHELREAEPRLSWLTLQTCRLLMALAEADFESLAMPDGYLRRSQREMARAVYQQVVAHDELVVELSGLAERFGVSEASLRTYFARVYGESPSSFARGRILAKAVQLLSQTDGSVADVAQACGYANPSKFSAAFRRAYGVNPLEYRRRSRLA